MESLLLVVAFWAYPLAYTVYAAAQLIVDTCGGNYLESNNNLVCDAFIDIEIAAPMLFWYLPGAFVFALLAYRFKRPWVVPLIVAPIGIFFANLITMNCPPERMLMFQTLAKERNNPWNSTNFFTPTATDNCHQTTIVYSFIAATLIATGIEPFMVAQYAVLSARVVGSTVFAAMVPRLNKLFGDPAGEMCRRGHENPDRVFDTRQSGWGPMAGDYMWGLSAAVAVFAAVAIACYRVGRIKLGKLFDVGSYVVAAVLLAQFLYVQRNPGCMTGIEAVTSNGGRVGLTFMAVAWVLPPFVYKTVISWPQRNTDTVILLMDST